jgi:hypothetical protein
VVHILLFASSTYTHSSFEKANGNVCNGCKTMYKKRKGMEIRFSFGRVVGFSIMMAFC